VDGQRALNTWDRRDLEIERLKGENERLRERERAVRAEAEDTKRRLSELTAASKRFASSMRGGARERQQYLLRLAAQLAVSRVLSEARDLDEAAPKVFEILGERLGWEVGVLWLPSGNVLRCAGEWRRPGAPPGAFEEACERSNFRRGVELPGRVWERGEPVWVEDVVEDADFSRKEAAAEDNLHGAFAFPIRDGGLVGVFELFRREALPPDDDLLRTAALIGDQIGQFVERRRAEEEREELRREAEMERARLEAILQQMPGGVVIADHSGSFALANEGTERIYGQKIRSLAECSRHTLTYPEGRSTSPGRSTVARALGGEHVSGAEHYVVRADGTRRIVSVNAAPVRDERGRVVAAVKVFEDVTLRKEAERALRESEERLRSVVEGAPVVLWSADREGVFTLAVGQGHEALGIEPGSVVGRSIFDVFEYDPEVLEDARRALRGEAFAAVREVRGGVWDTTYAPLHDDNGGFAGIIAVAVNVTERERAEEERARAEARERAARAEVEEAQRRLAYFAGAREERQMISRELHDRVAHSMAVVRQCLELYEALGDRDPEAAAAKMEQAKDEAKSALQATRDLSMMLRRSEIEGGLARSLSGLLETTAPPDVRYEVSVEGDEAAVPPHVANQVFLILREAIRNAVAHSDCKRVAVGIEVAPSGLTGFVEDDGSGLKAGGGKSNGGVGLRSMKERAALLGGAVRVSSRPDAGTKVEVSVPLTEEDVR
jgi:PAS domain S-box-containing protein